MDKYICKAKRIDNGEWVYGAYLSVSKTICTEKTYPNSTVYIDLFVDPETVCSNTGMTEFVVTDKSINQPLFEGDIVEVNSLRRPYAAWPQSKYDGEVKVRAVIHFERGMWQLDYDNAHNNKMCEPRGNEQYERSVEGALDLYYYGYHGKPENEEWYREHNQFYTRGNIVKIGNIHDNPELLEG